MPRLEKDIEDAVVLHAISLNYMHFKCNALGSRGKPDQLFIAPSGRTFFVEFKRPGEPLRPLQWYWARHLYVRKQVVYRCENIDHGKRILTNHLDPSALPIEGAVAHDETRKYWFILGPRAREDFHLPYGPEDSERPPTDI